MTPEQAVKILEEIVDRSAFNKVDHDTVYLALNTVKEALADKKEDKLEKE